MINVDVAAKNLAESALIASGEIARSDYVRISKIAEFYKAKVEYASILHDGHMSINDDGYLIKINRNIPSVRMRYTLAHEIGHIVYLQNYGDEEVQNAKSSKLEEHFCQRFAANLLMPDNLLNLPLEWEKLSLIGLIKKARQLNVNAGSLAMRIVEQMPLDGGVLLLRLMGKRENWSDKKWRLHWGYFPALQGAFIPNHQKLKDFPVVNAIEKGELDGGKEMYFSNVKLAFGHIKTSRNLAAVAQGDRKSVICLVYPNKFTPIRFSFENRPIS